MSRPHGSLFISTQEVIENGSEDWQENNRDNPEDLLFVVLVASEDVHNHQDINDYNCDIQ